MTDYRILNEQLKALSEGVDEQVTLLSNAAALLYWTLPDLNWAGFYLARESGLVLGPFVGKPACVKIAYGRGVCGTAAEKNETLLIPDVHAFPGHIACDGASNAEIVVPLRTPGGEVLGVMDLDSPVINRFSAADRAGLEAFAAVIEQEIG